MQFWDKEVRDTLYTVNIISTDERCPVTRDKHMFAASAFDRILLTGEKSQF